jgi:UPF0716 family protein affecting phage T7 exclusion
MFSPVAVVIFLTFVLELVLLTQVASLIGALATALVVVALTILGFFLLRSSGAGLLRSALDQASSGLVFGEPDDAAKRGGVNRDGLADRSLVVLGSLLLAVPGFATAFLGALLFVPPIRAGVRPLVVARFPRIVGFEHFVPRNSRGGDVIDVDTVGSADPPNDHPCPEPPTSARPELS